MSGKIEIRGSDGKVRIHDLPAEVRDSIGNVEPRDSVGPIRRDSIGMRMLVKDSWSSELRKRRKAPSTLRDVIRSVASWVLLFGLSIDILALLLEPFFLTRSGAPLRPAIARPSPPSVSPSSSRSASRFLSRRCMGWCVTSAD